jgi:hypothetical protein
VPFEIPKLRFVKAAVAYSEKLLDNALGTSSSTSHHAAHLLEQLLPMGDLFIKYIHNADAITLQDHNELGYNTASFSASFNMSSSFLHMAKLISLTSKAGVDDFHYQAIFLTSFIIVALGAKHLLTDPQVMIHP